MTALDVTNLAYQRLARWAASLAVLKEKEEMQRETGVGAHMQHMTRFGQFGPLMRLGRSEEAEEIVARAVRG